MGRLDIGIASYGNAIGLERTLRSLEAMSTTDWHCIIVSNPHPSVEEQSSVMLLLESLDEIKYEVIVQKENIGYAGAVNVILAHAATEYIAYLDHDVQILTPGWDTTMCTALDRFHEIGMLFPAGGAAPIPRGNYVEILWGVGCAWMTTRMAAEDAAHHASMLNVDDEKRMQYFDESLGHQEEVDFQTRLRLQGYKLASLPDVRIAHMATASSDPANTERISRGVVNWVNKWNKYFCGKAQTYHSPNVLRHEDWPPSALYLEEYYMQMNPTLNAKPEVVIVNGAEYDLIKVPRLKGFYRNRII
jgi:GT2 family glycosyltransferase